MLKGGLHVHSTYSDGDFTLPELREIFRAAGCSFVCITDHAESFTGEKLGEYIQECRRLSGPEFCFVPGLEYECKEKMHILSYGQTSLVNTTDPQEVIAHIEARSGIAVIAHPKTAAFPYIETFEILPSGIEGWNTKYDGRYAPRPGVFELVERLRKRKPALSAFYGQDLHYRKQFHDLYTTIPLSAANPTEILAALSSGDFAGRCRTLDLPARAALPGPLLARFARTRIPYALMRRTLRGMKSTAKRCGLKIPAGMVSQFRKIM